MKLTVKKLKLPIAGNGVGWELFEEEGISAIRIVVGPVV